MNIYTAQALAEIARAFDAIGRLDFSDSEWRHDITISEQENLFFLCSIFPNAWARNTGDKVRLEASLRWYFRQADRGDIAAISEHIHSVFSRYATELTSNESAPFLLYEILEYGENVAESIRGRIRAAGHTV